MYNVPKGFVFGSRANWEICKICGEFYKKFPEVKWRMNKSMIILKLQGLKTAISDV